MLASLNVFTTEIPRLHKWAEEVRSTDPRGCKRKGVGCSAWTWMPVKDVFNCIHSGCHNGPSGAEHECSNEVGKCGCSHSEPRLTIDLLRFRAPRRSIIMAVGYSPCSNCANIMVDSQLYCGCVYDILTEHDVRGLDILRRGGIVVLTIDSIKEAIGGNATAIEECHAAIERWKLARH